MFKSQNKLAKAFRFKDRIPKELHLVSSINFSVDSAMNPIMRDNPSLNKNIRSAPLYLFEKV